MFAFLRFIVRLCCLYFVFVCGWAVSTIHCLEFVLFKLHGVFARFTVDCVVSGRGVSRDALFMLFRVCGLCCCCCLTLLLFRVSGGCCHNRLWWCSFSFVSSFSCLWLCCLRFVWCCVWRFVRLLLHVLQFVSVVLGLVCFDGWVACAIGCLLFMFVCLVCMSFVALLRLRVGGLCRLGLHVLLYVSLLFVVVVCVCRFEVLQLRVRFVVYFV